MNFITRFKRGRTRHYEAHNALHNVGPVKPDVMKAHARSAAEPPAITDAYKDTCAHATSTTKAFAGELASRCRHGERTEKQQQRNDRSRELVGMMGGRAESSTPHDRVRTQPGDWMVRMRTGVHVVMGECTCVVCTGTSYPQDARALQGWDAAGERGARGAGGECARSMQAPSRRPIRARMRAHQSRWQCLHLTLVHFFLGPQRRACCSTAALDCGLVVMKVLHNAL